MATKWIANSFLSKLWCFFPIPEMEYAAPQEHAGKDENTLSLHSPFSSIDWSKEWNWLSFSDSHVSLWWTDSRVGSVTHLENGEAEVKIPRNIEDVRKIFQSHWLWLSSLARAAISRINLGIWGAFWVGTTCPGRQPVSSWMLGQVGVMVTTSSSWVLW